MVYANFSCELNHFLRQNREKGARELVAIGLLDSLAGASKQMGWPTNVIEGWVLGGEMEPPSEHADNQNKLTLLLHQKFMVNGKRFIDANRDATDTGGFERR